MNEKLLTIIVAVYNMEDYLPKCLSSIIVDDDDLMDSLEVIVVNDGSTDKSLEIAHDYEKHYPRTFVVIDKDNHNYGSCINAALKRATGQYIKTLDADDWLDTENFKEYLQVLAKSGADAVLHYAMVVRNKSNECIPCGLTADFFCRFEAGRTVFSFSELVATENFRPSMHNVTYRTQIFRDIDYKQIEGIFYTDNQWMFLPMSRVKKVALFPKVVYYYLLGREGQTVSPKSLLEHFDDELVLRRHLLQDYLQYDGDDVGRLYLKTEYHKHLRYLYFHNIIEERYYKEKNIRRFDNMLRDMGYPYYEEMNSWRIPNADYRHSVTVGFWRKWDGRWFYMFEGTLKFFWDPYKKLKKKFMRIVGK